MSKPFIIFSMRLVLDTCKYVKEACYTLAVSHKNTSIMKLSKLWMLTAKFENIKMKDDEAFFEFYIELNDIINFEIFGSKVARKILRSLPKRFRLKVSTVKHSKYMTW